MEGPVLSSLTRPDPRLVGQPLARSCLGCCLSYTEVNILGWCCFLQATNTKVNSSELQGGWHQDAEVCSSLELLGTCLQSPCLSTRSPWRWTTVGYPKEVLGMAQCSWCITNQKPWTRQASHCKENLHVKLFWGTVYTVWQNAVSNAIATNKSSMQRQERWRGTCSGERQNTTEAYAGVCGVCCHLNPRWYPRLLQPGTLLMSVVHVTTESHADVYHVKSSWCLRSLLLQGPYCCPSPMMLWRHIDVFGLCCCWELWWCTWLILQHTTPAKKTDK